ncbi:hypothetical protein Zmor_009419 [Zophobas morio]|uniref:SIAH-type domain-containing protein n=1 Tax=Zophobas morio TaxID=2755281 RepID=A0AA38IIS5_9CUCU|nr:hypothetical protein Zmor_009419 [Zophobas morio]
MGQLTSSHMEFVTAQARAWVEKLKCANCGNFLSYFPIHTTLKSQNICGRCPTPSETVIRNQLYELLSLQIQFPCRYAGQGCPANKFPAEIPQHELQCTFKELKCPTQDFTDCNTKVCYRNLITHCQVKHRDLFLEKGLFEFPLGWYHKHDGLLEHRNQLFIVRRKFRVEDNLFQISVTPSECGEDTVWLYRVHLTCGSAELGVKGNTKVGVTEIFLDSLVTQKGKASKISGKLFVMKSSNPKIVKDDIKALPLRNVFPSTKSDSTKGQMGFRGIKSESLGKMVQKRKDRLPFYASRK